MILRAILLVALIAFLLPAVAPADSVTIVPSRKAAVVIPLLSHLSVKTDSKKDVLAVLDKILGDYETTSAIRRNDQVQESYSYHLDDGGKVVAIFLDARLVMIYSPTRNDPDRVVYPHPAPQ